MATLAKVIVMFVAGLLMHVLPHLDWIVGIKFLPGGKRAPSLL